MQRLLIIAPHPDDELLGCGGTILRHLEAGDEVHWLIASRMSGKTGFTPEQIDTRDRLVERVREAVGFHSLRQLDFPATRLDTVPLGDLVKAIGDAVTETRADTLYLPYGGDVHSDHGVVFNAAKACSKWFRYPDVRRVYIYETLSETEFALPPDGPGIPLNRYVDISAHINRKLELLKLYEGELGEFPFPRSITAVEALALLRGSASGCTAAEGFQVLKEIL